MNTKIKSILIMCSLVSILVSCQSQEGNPSDDVSNVVSVAPSDDVADEGSFTAYTLDGKTVTSDIFAEYDITLINIWATWCGPCVNEMPYIQEVYENLPDNVNLITICHDGESQHDLAVQILEASNAEFDTITLTDELEKGLLSTLQAFPTTLFVNSKGEVLKTQKGVPQPNVTENYLSMVDELLATL